MAHMSPINAMTSSPNDVMVNETMPMPTWAEGILWTVTVLISLQTVLGNLLVLVAFGTDKTLRQTSNFLIVSLAISDLIIGIEGFPFLTYYVTKMQKWYLGQFGCKLWLSLDYTLCLVSIITVLLITIDRFLSVCYTAKYRTWQSDVRMMALITASWAVSFAFFAGMIYGYYAKSLNFVANFECYAPFLDNAYLNMSMYLIYYWATLVAMIVLYHGIHKVASEVQGRAEAKEKQAIAMAALQRCMAQMGVSIIVATDKVINSGSEAFATPQIAQQHTETIPDSGYSTCVPAAAAATVQAAPVVMERHLIPSKLSESDSAGDEAVQPSTASTTSGSFTSALSRTSTDSITKSPSCQPDLDDSSFSSYASDIGCESHSVSLNEEYFLSVETPILPHSPVKPTESMTMCGSDMTYHTAYSGDSGSTYRTSDDRKLSSSDRNSIAQLSDSDVTISGLASSCSRQPPILKSQQSWPLRTEPKNLRWLKQERTSLRIDRTPNYENIIECEEVFSTVTTVTDSCAQTNNSFKECQKKVEPLPSDFCDIKIMDNDEKPLVTRKLKIRHSELGLGMREIKRKQNVFISTLRRFSSPNTSKKLQPPGSSSSTPKSSITSIRKSASNRSMHKEADALSEYVTAKASRTFQGGSEFLSSLFNVHWLKGRRRQKTRAERRARKAFRTITIILGAFVLFWSPYYVFATVYGFCRTCIPGWLYMVSYYMCYLNSSVNPFCYAMANRQFKIAFTKILKGEINFKRTRAYSLRSQI